MTGTEILRACAIGLAMWYGLAWGVRWLVMML